MAVPISGEVFSDWGDWFPRAVVDAEPDRVAVWYLGCNGFVLKAADGTTLFIDPYFGLGKPPRTVRMIPVPMDPADVESAAAILATHEHSDHVDGPSQAPIVANTRADYFGPPAAISRIREEGWAAKWSVPPDKFRSVEPGAELTVGGFDISVEPAYDPQATDPVSYLIEYEGRTFFHGGDTRFDETVLERIGTRYDIDLGVLAFGSVGIIPDKRTWERRRTYWYADETEVTDAAQALRLDRLLPSHWDMWRGLTADPTGLFPHVRSFEYPDRLEIVEIGDRVEL
jgi:L-ascorbate 6-phosphate lactonase